MAKASKKAPPDSLSHKKALDLYRNTLNHNVISRYDPGIKQLLYSTSHCVIYKFDDDAEEWKKTEYQGTLAFYLREFVVPGANFTASYADLQQLFCYGLILLNRSNPECFLLGLLPNHVIRHYFPHGVNNSGILKMDVELNDNLIIVKNLLGEIYGLWIFSETDRMKLYKLLEFCLTSQAATGV